MSKSKLYTKTGDKGETSLVSGTRVPKSELQIDLYGEVDELNSHIGYLLSLMANDKELELNQKSLLTHLQNKLFDLGSLLACEPAFWEQYKLPIITKTSIEKMEENIDAMDSKLQPLKNFILPGGALSGSYAHVVRTISRRCERKLIHYRNLGHEIPEYSIELLNRMSDYFFVLSRYINFELGQSEQIWTKNT